MTISSFLCLNSLSVCTILIKFGVVCVYIFCVCMWDKEIHNLYVPSLLKKKCSKKLCILFI
jgi:hypothetical protein